MKIRMRAEAGGWRGGAPVNGSRVHPGITPDSGPLSELASAIGVGNAVMTTELNDDVVRLFAEVRELVARLPEPDQPTALDDLFVIEICLRELPPDRLDTGLLGRLLDRVDAALRQGGHPSPVPELLALATTAGFRWGGPR